MNKFISKFFTVICSVMFVFGLTGCSSKSHKWSTEWNGNNSNHWHDCTDASCKQRTDITPHSWTLTSTLEKPTCTEEGSGVYTCFICGKTKTDTIETSGHNWVLFKTEYEATCITDGRGAFRCADCAIMQDKMVIPATGAHRYSNDWLCDEAGHYHVCTTEGCEATTQSINHVESGPITVPEQDYVDGADEMRCADCNYLLSSVRRPAKSIPVSFDVQFGAILATDGKVQLTASSAVAAQYRLSFPNAVNENGDSISNVPCYVNGTGVAVFMVLNDLGAEAQITYDSETLTNGFTLVDNALFVRRIGDFTLKFKFMVNDVVKSVTTVKVSVRA